MVRLHARVMLRKVPPAARTDLAPDNWAVSQNGVLFRLMPTRPAARHRISYPPSNGPARQTLIVERAAERGFSDDQLHRAKRLLGIKAFKQRGQPHAPWLWALPAGCTGGRGRTGMRAGENRSRSRSRSRKQKTATLENF